jgi:hypothetical protein
MAEAEPRGTGLAGRLLGGLALVAATALWVAAIWLALYRPDLLAPFGPEAQLVAIAVVWALPVLLTILAWLSLRRARRALAEARALHAETDALARRLQAERDSARRAVRDAAWPPPWPPAAGPDVPVPDTTSEWIARPFTRAPAADAETDTGAGEAAPAPLWSALDFPTSEADTAGFDALRRALSEDPKLAAVIRTAQHVLALLAQEGVHLDEDDAPPPVPPEVLRQYAGGVRGPGVAALGAMEDRETLALAVGRLRRDPVFRSAARRFIAAFDAWLASVVAEVDDTALARIAATRSGRAFRLLGRATGKFG